MFWLPLTRGGATSVGPATTLWPLGEYATLLLVSGLLVDDLDDRVDKLRGALEIDPLLALWTALRAAALASPVPCDSETAARWLGHDFLRAFQPRERLLATAILPAEHRVRWQDFTRRTVGLARLAGSIAQESAVHSPWVAHQAYYMVQLVNSFQWLRQNESLPGATSGGPSGSFPGWLAELSRATTVAGESSRGTRAAESATSTTENSFPGASPCWDPRACEAVRRAMEQVDQEADCWTAWMRRDETRDWFWPLPELQHLLAAVLAKLSRLAELEHDFAAQLEEEKLRSLRQFAYGASHEINNPLANISTRAQTLLQSETDADRRKKLWAIHRQAIRAFEMLADLMLFARPPRLQPTRFHLDDILAPLAGELGELATEAAIEVRWRIHATCPAIVADRDQLCVALRAIGENSMEAMGRDGTLELSAAPDGCGAEFVEITVRDTGPGIPPEVRRHLFDPFYSGREAGRGLGFGLSKAWTIVRRHGGQIMVESRLGQGATFRLRLPIDAAEFPIADEAGSFEE